MPRSQTIRHDADYLPPVSHVGAAIWMAARKHLIDLIPFLSMVALLAFIIIDNARR